VLPSALACALVVAACGQGDSTAVETAAVAPGAVNNPASPTGPDFARWCESNMGSLSADQARCQFQQTVNFGRNYMVYANSWWNSGVQVYVNDTVTLTVSGHPKMRMGMEHTANVTSGTYVAASNGSLAFSSQGRRDEFSVQKIQIRRCFDNTRTSVRCQ
jgi:hypothetical protein